MPSSYAIYLELKNKETGISFDESTGQFQASDAWWATAIKQKSAYKHFKKPSVTLTLLGRYGHELFGGSLATGRHARRACDFSTLDLNNDPPVQRANDFRDSIPDNNEGMGSSDGPGLGTRENATIGCGGTTGSKRKSSSTMQLEPSSRPRQRRWGKKQQVGEDSVL